MVKNLLANAGDTRDVGLIPGEGHDPWKRAWQPTPVFLPGKSHGQRSLVGDSPLGRRESDMAEHLGRHVPCSVLSCYQVLLSMKYSRQEYWSGSPFPSPGDLPNPEIEPCLLHYRQILHSLP